MKLSVVICTHNRAAILQQCMDSILLQLIPQEYYEVIIIDNNSTDKTAALVQTYCAKYPNVQYFFESKQGLSHARNRGYQVAQSEWAVYIDDDAKVRPDYLSRALAIIQKEHFDCFGGMYYAWFLFGKPNWLPEGFGDKELVRADLGLIDGRTGWLSGGNMAVKKKVLEAVGGFDPDFGMKGQTIAYGEENDLQQKLLDRGYKIGFDPDLIIDHAVLPHKLKIGWHLKNSYARGKYSRALSNQDTDLKSFFMIFKSFLGTLFKQLPKSLFKFFTNKDYALEHLVLDVCIPPLWYIGFFKGIKKS